MTQRMTLKKYTRRNKKKDYASQNSYMRHWFEYILWKWVHWNTKPLNKRRTVCVLLLSSASMAMRQLPRIFLKRNLICMQDALSYSASVFFSLIIATSFIRSQTYKPTKLNALVNKFSEAFQLEITFCMRRKFYWVKFSSIITRSSSSL